jgi:hypothetical protein
MIVFAHAGHIIVDLLYAAPLLVMIVLLVIGKMRERRNQRSGGLSGPGPGISAGDDGRADP